MSSPKSAHSSELGPRTRAEHSESTEAEEHSFSVAGSDVADHESDIVSISQHSLYDEDPVSNMGNRRAYAKKQTTIINKLKYELAQARNIIAMSKINDMVILKTKLRAAELDLSRVRVQNMEFKESIERLELHLYEALSENAQRSSKKKVDVPPPDISAAADEDRVPSLQSGPEKQTPDAEKVLKKEELWLLRRKTTKIDDMLLSLPDQMGRDVNEHIRCSIEQAAIADRKTISELIKELHRVEEKQRQQNDIKKCDRCIGPDISIKPCYQEQEPGSGAYSQRDILYSFFAGAVLMLLSVIVSAIGSRRSD